MNRPIEFAVDLTLTAEGQAPEWVHLLPLGHFAARDGRVFDNSDPAALIATFRARAVDLPIEERPTRGPPEWSGSGGWLGEGTDAPGGWYLGPHRMDRAPAR